MRSFAIVARQEAGRGTAGCTAMAVDALLKERGASSQVYVASDERSLAAVVAFAARDRAVTAGACLCIVICGGDGSIQEGVNAALSSAPPDVLVGLAPAGTCNDFAFALGIKPDAEKIVDVLLDGEPRAIDLGMAGDKYFCTIATLGLESVVNRCLRDYVTRSPPRSLLIATACAVLMTHRPFHATVTLDDNTLNVEILSLLAANTPSYGGQIQIAPSATPTDGQIDVVLFHAMSRVRRLRMLLSAVAGRHFQRPGVTCQRASRVIIETKQPWDVWADGEPIGTTPIEIKVASKALRVLLPA